MVVNSGEQDGKPKIPAALIPFVRYGALAELADAERELHGAATQETLDALRRAQEEVERIKADKGGPG